MALGRTEAGLDGWMQEAGALHGALEPLYEAATLALSTHRPSDRSR